MNECIFEIKMNKKIKPSLIKKIFRFISIGVSIIIILFLLLLLSTGVFSFSEILPTLFIAILLMNYGKSKYKEYEYKCVGVMNVTETDEIVFDINNFNDENNKIYDLRIKFPKNQIDYIDFGKNPNVTQIAGGYVRGYPIIEKSSGTVNEFVDCYMNKEEVSVLYDFNFEKYNYDELINKLDRIMKNN